MADEPKRPIWLPDTQGFLAISIIALIAIIVLVLLMKPPAIDERTSGVLQTVVGVLIACLKDVYSFFFGSSKGSQAKDDTQSKIVEKLTSTQPAGTPGPVAPVAAPTVTPWWSLLTDDERKAISSITGDSRVLEFQINAKVGRAEFADLAYLVKIGALTQARADVIASA